MGERWALKGAVCGDIGPKGSIGPCAGGHTAQNRNQSNNKWEMTSRDIVQI